MTMKLRLACLGAATACLAVAGASAVSAAPAPTVPAGALAAAPEAQQPVPAPTVTGPVAVTEDSFPFLSTDVVDDFGYVEEEFFLEGTAFDDIFQVPSAYKTRIVVRRPAAAQDANGTVVLEWNNVTGGYDQEYDWFTSHEYFMRSGITWVGVSNQYVGVQELKRRKPQRYSTLRFEGDGASDDVYSQAAQALLAPTGVDPLAGSRPRLLLAAGHSQSGSKLAGYYNDEQPEHALFDGFMLRGIENDVDTDAVRVPVLRVQTETDFTEGSKADDVDSEFYRRWDVAGASHVDHQQVTYKDPLVLRDRGSLTPVVCLEEPYSRIPFQHALNAGYESMARWLTTGTPPPSSPRFTANGLDVIQRDAWGNALGGIRLPQHEVPTATNTGDNQGAGFCFLYGSYQPFDQQTLNELYPTHEAYVTAIEHVAAQRVAEGFLLPADAEKAVAAARAADLGLPRAQPAAGRPGTAEPATTAPAAGASASASTGGASTGGASTGSASSAGASTAGASTGSATGAVSASANRALAATGPAGLLPLAGAGVLLAVAVAARARRTSPDA
jgi:hypothetical protein